MAYKSTISTISCGGRFGRYLVSGTIIHQLGVGQVDAQRLSNHDE